jgi:ABC-type proline/glycine betaine transport system ATPase subunit
MKIVTLENYITLLKSGSVVAYGESDHIGPCDGYVSRITTENDQFFVNGLDMDYVFDQYDWVWLIEL